MAAMAVNPDNRTYPESIVTDAVAQLEKRHEF